MWKMGVRLIVGITILIGLLTISVKNGVVLAAVGDAQWAKSTSTGPNTSLFNGIKTDSSGNSYSVGYIYGSGTYNFGNGVTVAGAGSGENTVIVKYNSSGLAQWAKSTTTGPASSMFQGVSIDATGNAYVVGYISGTGTYNFGNSITVAGANSGTNTVIVKYNSSGLAQWAKSTTTGPNSSYLYAVTVDSDGNSYAAGYIFGSSTYNFGNGVTVGSAGSSNDVILIKYDSSGLAQWAKSTASGPSSSSFYGVSLDSDSNVYAVGYISGTSSYNFGNGITVSGGFTDGNTVIVKYNSSGLAQWAKSTTGSSGASSLQGVVVDSDGNVYVVGYVISENSFNFGNSVTVTGGNASSNAIIVKYNSSGLAQWARSTAAGSPESIFVSITIDSNNYLYVAGSITSDSEFNFGNGVTVTGQYSFDTNAVLIKYNSSGLAQWARSTTTANGNSLFNGVSVDTGGSTYVVGGINNNELFGFKSGVTVSGGYNGGQNSVIVKYSDMADTQAGVGSGSSINLSIPGSNICNSETPVSIPNLFQINITGTSAKLFFTPIINTNGFYISYSTKPNAEEHGVGMSLAREGVQNFTINSLKPNTKYYFKVRGQNGCMTGKWSSVLSARSSSQWNTIPFIFYKYN